MTAMKYTDGLWAVDSTETTERLGCVYRQGHPDEIVCDNVYGPTDEHAEGNAHLIAAAPWYRVLALIAVAPGCSIYRLGTKKPGWRASVGSHRWAWQGGDDEFGVPAAPPENMFLEIKQAVEDLRK